MIQCANKKNSFSHKEILEETAIRSVGRKFPQSSKSRFYDECDNGSRTLPNWKNAYVDKLAFKCGSLPKEKNILISVSLEKN